MDLQQAKGLGIDSPGERPARNSGTATIAHGIIGDPEAVGIID